MYRDINCLAITTVVSTHDNCVLMSSYEHFIANCCLTHHSLTYIHLTQCNTASLLAAENEMKHKAQEAEAEVLATTGTITTHPEIISVMP